MLRRCGSNCLRLIAITLVFTISAGVLYVLPSLSRLAFAVSENSLAKADSMTQSVAAAQIVTGYSTNAMTTGATKTSVILTTISAASAELKQFSSIMTDDERGVMATMLGHLTDAMEAANLTYHMCAGTLIGSYRHHGMIPWDDDVDIYARWVESHRLETLVKSRLSNEYVLVKAETRWKLYSKRQSAVIPGWRWNYPFIDICFVLENDSWVWDYDKVYGGKFRYRLSTVYPLRRRPFMNMWLWAPNDVETYLRTTYDINKCKSNLYIHKHEKTAKKVYTVDCRRLWPYYPFVFRSNATLAADGRNAVPPEAIVEELKIGDNVISKVVVNQALVTK